MIALAVPTTGIIEHPKACRNKWAEKYVFSTDCSRTVWQATHPCQTVRL